MRIALAILCALAAAPPAFAHLAQKIEGGHVTGLSVMPPLALVVTDRQIGPIFMMGDGGCLRGPMQFRDTTGTPTFTLSAGVDYPAGCADTWRAFK